MRFAPTIDRIKSFLAKALVSVAVVLLAITVRSFQVLFFFNLRSDASYQVLATDHWLHGNGISLGSVNPADLSQTIYTPLVSWPPGFSVLLAPFYYAFGEDYVWACLTLDIVFGVALIFILRKILSLLAVHTWIINLFTVLGAFFVYPFYSKASSDDVAAVFLIAALIPFLKIIASRNGSSSTSMLLTFLVFGAAFIKYLYIPVAFVLPLIVLAKGLVERNRGFVRSGILSTGLLSVIMLGFLVYQQIVRGAAAYVPPVAKGFYPANLLAWYPAPVAAFLTPDTASLIWTKANLPLKWLMILFQWAGLILAGWITVRLVNHVRKKGIATRSLAGWFVVAAVSLSAAVMGLLAALSLRYAMEENAGPTFWTYVEEPRYYAVVLLLLQTGLFLGLARGWHKRWKEARFICIILLLGFCIEALRGAAFTANRVRNFGREEYSWQYELRLQRYADSIVQQMRKASPAQMIVTGDSYYINHRISLYSHVPVLYNESVLSGPQQPKTNTPVHVLIVRSSGDSRPSGDAKVGRFDNVLFYTRLIE